MRILNVVDDSAYLITILVLLDVTSDCNLWEERMNTRDILITDDQADRSPNWRGLRVSVVYSMSRDQRNIYT